MKRALLIGGLGITAVTLGVIAVMALLPSPANSPQVATQTAGQPPTPAVTASATSTKAQITKPNVEKHRTSAQLQRQFANATDLRAFALDAMRRPNEGGYLYAIKAIGECASSQQQFQQFMTQSNTEQLKQSGTIGSRTLAAQNRVRQMCASFTQGETASMALQVAALSKSNSSNQPLDPLLSTSRTATKAHIQYQHLNAADSEQKQQKTAAFMSALKDALEYKDPELNTSDLIIRLATFNPDGSSWFEGTQFSDKDTGQLHQGYLRAMLEIAECSFGPGCQLERQMLAQCAVGDCFDDKVAFSRFLFVQTKMGTPEKFDQALKYLPQIQAALQRGDVKAFLPPK